MMAGPFRRRGMSRRIGWGVILAVLASVVVAGAEDRVSVRWVVDGDTVVLRDGRHLRYPGINCPETARGDRPGEALGEEARQLNRRLVAAGPVRLAPAAPPQDRYGRYLADLLRPDGTSASQALVAAGLAYVLPAEPHYTVDPVLLEAQRQAMRRGEGIWARIQRQPVSLTGNRRSRRFHRADTACAKSVGKRHGVTFADYLQAFDAGYAPCRRCFERLDELMQKEPAAQRAK